MARLEFEYAATLRDRALELTGFRDRLVAWRGEVEGLTFLYRVPGFHGADRLYLIRRGRVRWELDYPKGTRARSLALEHIEDVFGTQEALPRTLEADEAAEILFVAAWFRGRPRELKRTCKPDQWLASYKLPTVVQ